MKSKEQTMDRLPSVDSVKQPAILSQSSIVTASSDGLLDLQPKIATVVVAQAPIETFNDQNLLREMPAKIIKRDGSIVDFKKSKITKVVWKAMQAVGHGTYDEAVEVSDKVVRDLIKNVKKTGQMPTVEQTQDSVEKQLMLSKFTDVAKSFILYRDLHSRHRNVHNLMDIASQVDSYLGRADWKVNANSEIDYTLQGLYKYISDEVSEMYWMNEIYTAEMRDLHENCDFHIHKSSSLSSYCVGWDLQDLLLSGFQGVPGNVASGPAKHFRSALGQLVNFMYTLTQETPDGAVAISNFDTFLAPFIRYDKIDYKEVRQGIQEFIYNMNVPTKVGGQVVFSNITLDLECPEYMKTQPVIIGGKFMDKTYGDFQVEMDMVNKALTEVYTQGDRSGRAFNWPIPTYNITKNFDWENKNLEGLWDMTAKYGIPYFSNFVNSDMDPADARSMCCRLRIDNRELHKRGGGLFGSNPLTGSIGYVTINMPRLGYDFKGDKKAYLKRLGYLMDKASESLILRRELIENMTEKGLYPYCKFYLRNVKEKSDKYWSNHFNTIGLVGMNESCLNFFGKDITTPEGQDFTKEVMDFMNKKMVEYQESTGIMYNLEASPAEATAYKLAKHDKKEYPDIIVANEAEYIEGAEPYYTNSTQLPVGFTDDIFEALDLQDDIQTKYTGGTVFHGFLGERMTSGEEVKKLVKKISSSYKLPYFTITPTFSVCESHGYVTGEHFECPKCGKECRVYSRVVGKIAPVQRWNLGKKAEFKDRNEFVIKS